MKIIHIEDDVKRLNCTFCKKKFNESDERINTCTQNEYVTLCRQCYNETGNSVR